MAKEVVELAVSVAIDDADMEKDFYNVLFRKHQQSFINKLNGDLTLYDQTTEEDKRAFVDDVLSQMVLQEYVSTSIQHQTQEFQNTLIEQSKGTMKARETPSPFVLARAERQSIASAAAKAQAKPGKK